jgi:hypothetical protein
MAMLDGYLPESEFAVQINKSIRTFVSWRTQRTGPPWIKVGKEIYYSKAAAREWLKSIEVHAKRSRSASRTPAA